MNRGMSAAAVTMLFAMLSACTDEGDTTATLTNGETVVLPNDEGGTTGGTTGGSATGFDFLYNRLSADGSTAETYWYCDVDNTTGVDLFFHQSGNGIYWVAHGEQGTEMTFSTGEAVITIDGVGVFANVGVNASGTLFQAIWYEGSERVGESSCQLRG